jgi:AraC-like DNA-binding protein
MLGVIDDTIYDLTSALSHHSSGRTYGSAIRGALATQARKSAVRRGSCRRRLGHPVSAPRGHPVSDRDVGRVLAHGRWSQRATAPPGGRRILLPRRRAFQLATDTTLLPVDVAEAFAGAQDSIASYNGGGEFFSLWSVFAVTGKPAEVLLEGLPPVIHVQRVTDQSGMRESINRLMRELRDRQPGFYLVAQNCSYTMLVQLLREHLSRGSREGVGWLFALADQQISKAVNAMHSDPSRRWTLEELAKDVGMSRSAFAVRFKARVATSPMEYLTRWRMLLAGDKLTGSDEPLAKIAFSLGYESESSFSNAFKRVMGCSPRQYSRDRNAGLGLQQLEAVED